MDEEIGSDAIFIRQQSDSSAADTWLSRRQADPSRWHLIDPLRALTWCDLDIGYGNPRLLWRDTPEDLRCLLCLSRLSSLLHRSHRSP